LVRTSDNFGATGEKPSHPELLDTLAVQFAKDGWSVKNLIRSLVLSHTYQLSGAHDSFASETDPDNRLLWPFSQPRLHAEPSRVVASRDVTNVPSQALFMMNNDFVRAQSTAMAKRILASPLDHSARLDLAYHLTLGRSSTDAERKRADQYLLDEAKALVPL